MPKYTIEIVANPTEVRMYEADKDLVRRCLEAEYIDSFFGDYDFEEGGSCYYEERELLTYSSDFHLTVKDEDGNVVFETEDFSDIRLEDGCDEDGEELDGWEFKGIDDGNYLISVDTIKREWWEGELELDEEFDPDKLFYLRSRRFNDEFPYIGDDVADIWDLHYGEVDMEEDSDCSSTLIDLEGGDNNGSYGWSAYIVNCRNMDEWEEIEEMPEDEDGESRYLLRVAYYGTRIYDIEQPPTTQQLRDDEILEGIDEVEGSVYTSENFKKICVYEFGNEYGTEREPSWYADEIQDISIYKCDDYDKFFDQCEWVEDLDCSNIVDALAEIPGCADKGLTLYASFGLLLCFFKLGSKNFDPELIGEIAPDGQGGLRIIYDGKELEPLGNPDGDDCERDGYAYLNGVRICEENDEITSGMDADSFAISESEVSDSSIAFCPMCGAKVNGTDPFCPECGAALIGNQINNLQSSIDQQLDDLTSSLNQMLKNL